ncbi:hypothetical protein B7486_71240, partial [cyanobacterium TDX16]
AGLLEGAHQHGDGHLGRPPLQLRQPGLASGQRRQAVDGVGRQHHGPAVTQHRGRGSDIALIEIHDTDDAPAGTFRGMRAAVMRDRSLVVDDVADPVPQAGQVLAEVLACGICGSDLHALAHPEQMVAMAAEGADSMPAGMPSPTPMDLHRDVVMGHEISARVVDVGPEVHNRTVGDVVVSLPIAWDLGGIHPIGYSNAYPGGYAEQVVLNELLTFEVP